MEEKRILDLGKSLLNYCEEKGDCVKRYTSRQLDLFRADFIVSNGGYRLIGISYYLTGVIGQSAPIIMGESTKYDEQGIFDELVEQGKIIINNESLYYKLFNRFLPYSDIPEDTYEDVAEIIASIKADRTKKEEEV